MSWSSTAGSRVTLERRIWKHSAKRSLHVCVTLCTYSIAQYEASKKLQCKYMQYCETSNDFLYLCPLLGPLQHMLLISPFFSVRRVVWYHFPAARSALLMALLTITAPMPLHMQSHLRQLRCRTSVISARMCSLKYHARYSKPKGSTCYTSTCLASHFATSLLGGD